MQIGSLVECLGCDWGVIFGKGDISAYPIKGNVYVVSEIIQHKGITWIALEEIDENDVFDIQFFRELQPPMTISIDELLKEPEYETR